MFLYKECFNSVIKREAARTAQPRLAGLQKKSDGMKQQAEVT
jgi:hypothetical protein